MPNFDATITGFAAGDDLEIRRTLDRSESTLPSGSTITKAWLTVKTALADADVDAVVQKEVTTTDVVGTGRIEDDGTGDTDPVIRFDLTPTDTRAIGVTHRKYDIQVLTSDSKIYTGEKGHVYAEAEVTDDDV